MAKVYCYVCSSKHEESVPCGGTFIKIPLIVLMLLLVSCNVTVKNTSDYKTTTVNSDFCLDKCVKETVELLKNNETQLLGGADSNLGVNSDLIGIVNYCEKLLKIKKCQKVNVFGNMEYMIRDNI